MKKSLIPLLLPLLVTNASVAQDNFPVLEAGYFGQETPELIPKLFAPGIVSNAQRHEYGVSFSAGLDAMYFTAEDNGRAAVYFSTLENNRWTKPAKANLSNGSAKQEYGARVSAGGGTLFFSTESEQGDNNIWFATRSGDAWGEPSLLKPGSNNGNLAFASLARWGDIYYHNLVDGKLYYAPRFSRQYPYQYPVNIAYGTNGQVSPDQHYLLVEAHKDNDPNKDKDLFVYFKQEDGTWSQPVALGNGVNTPRAEGRPSLTSDGKFLFFSRYDKQGGNANIYWVSADVIQIAKERWQALRPNRDNISAPEIAEYDTNNLGFSFEQTLPDLQAPWIDTSPEDRNDAIVVGKLTSIGDRKASVLQFANELAEGKHGEYDSLLIAHNNQLLFESYYKKGRINLPHFQASATKSLNAMAVARAMQMGYLSMSDLHKPVVGLIAGLDKARLTEGAQRVTLHKAMNMRSGIVVNEAMDPIIFRNIMEVEGYNLIQEILEHSAPITPRAEVFRYQDPDPRIAMHLVDSAVPGSVAEFYKHEVFGKLGISGYGWRKDINGVPWAGAASSLTSRDMLKLGMVVQNEGKWQGEQLFSAEFLAKAMSSIGKAESDWMPDDYNYGYFWYQASMPVGEQNIGYNLAWGAGGNRIIVVDELDLVIVLTGSDENDKVMPKLMQALVPAFVKS